LRPLHTFGDSDQHLLWIAATQRASAAIRQVFDACHFPASGSGHMGNAIAAGARADYDQIEFISHFSVLLVRHK